MGFPKAKLFNTLICLSVLLIQGQKPISLPFSLRPYLEMVMTSFVQTSFGIGFVDEVLSGYKLQASNPAQYRQCLLFALLKKIECINSQSSSIEDLSHYN